MTVLLAYARSGPEQLGYKPTPPSAARPGETHIAVHPAATMFAELT